MSYDKHLILGGQKSGKTAHALQIAQQWLNTKSEHRAFYVATAHLRDDVAMQERIAAHQRERATQYPHMENLHAPLDLAAILHAYSQPHTLLLIDCLGMWLTNWMAPVELENPDADFLHTALSAWRAQRQAMLQQLACAAGPVLLVSNEVGLGVVPLGRVSRVFVDELGALNQATARVCQRVSAIMAGLPLRLKP